MKKITPSTLFFLLVFGNLFAQQEKGITGYNNWLDTWTDFQPNKTSYEEPTQILTGNITENTTLTKSNTYLLLGDVFVTDSTTITIEAGTVILGDYKTKGSLTISNGSRILAEGKPTDPIIFTSSKTDKKPGDWGGLFILGNAPINTFGEVATLNFGLKHSSTEHISYGGDNSDSDAGNMQYVRIEYAGKKTKEFGNYSGLTLAGVGLRTTINNVMVSYCQGNSFNILGGEVDLFKTISYRSNRDDYFFNFGTQAHIENALAVRSPYISSADGSRCMSIHSYDIKENADASKKETSITAENLTLLNVSNDLKSDIKVGLVQEAIFIGPDTSFNIHKSVISGFKPAVILDASIAINNENLKKIQFTRSYFNNCKGNIFRKDYTNNDDLESWYGSRAFDNVYSKGPDSETFIDSENNRSPDFRLRINKIIASNNLFDEDDQEDE
ncbi:hypothetical protein [Winogradskyella bathintestinalis]|uniref:T9SS C-terminal target domain-containing protein n=1 Tax=Winogradskyella bathintestinalis TaxID=3035208 RepID=A0ABT7ZX84_9FLAO|nr:hypothetical protein [Winogradskyella bathintestinalis]MDN3493600.1 hypothetical protein [Winogradskyella bathintestinalis]